MLNIRYRILIQELLQRICAGVYIQLSILFSLYVVAISTYPFMAEDGTGVGCQREAAGMAA
jgi:hypothetical protein